MPTSNGKLSDEELEAKAVAIEQQRAELKAELKAVNEELRSRREAIGVNVEGAQALSPDGLESSAEVNMA